MMKKLKYLFSILFFFCLILAAFINERKANYYKVSVKNAHAYSLDSAVFLSQNQIVALNDSILIVFLVGGDYEEIVELSNIKSLVINPVDLLDRELLKQLNKHNGYIVLESTDASISSRAFVLLNRIGFGNVRIMDDKQDELLRFSFKPDTLAGLK